MTIVNMKNSCIGKVSVRYEINREDIRNKTA